MLKGGNEMELTPGEVHKIAHKMNMLKRNYKKNCIHLSTVKAVINDIGGVYIEWKEDQGLPQNPGIPCSEFLFYIEDSELRDCPMCGKVKIHPRAWICDNCLPF